MIQYSGNYEMMIGLKPLYNYFALNEKVASTTVGFSGQGLMKSLMLSSSMASSES